ncbi:hypothetical protein HDU98_003694, partial [Podochytrium sp. JEL0797]
MDPAVKRLLQAGTISLTFFILEFTAGWISGSSSITAESYTLLVDVVGYAVGISSVYISSWPATNDYSWGFQRVQLLGAMITIFLSWGLAVGLWKEGISVLRAGKEKVEPHIMLASASADILRTIAMMYVLNGSRVDAPMLYDKLVDEADPETQSQLPEDNENGANINVMVAIVNAIADFSGALSIVLASCVLFVQPTWVILDPICTLFVGFVTFVAPFTLAEQYLVILMEGVPKHLDIEIMKTSLLEQPNVVSVESIKVWTLTQDLCCVVVVDISLEDFEMKPLHGKMVGSATDGADVTDWSALQACEMQSDSTILESTGDDFADRFNE